MSEFTTEQLTELHRQWTEQERERIIKLLTDQIPGCSGYECKTCNDAWLITRLIDLIEGKKEDE